MSAQEKPFYCDRCQDIGLVQTATGSRVCECQQRRRDDIRLRRAGIPEAFDTATLENFWPEPHTRWALGRARKFVEEFPGGIERGNGLMFTGSVGTGKTHLAVGMVRALVIAKGIEARFLTVPELLDRLRSSYAGEDAHETQARIFGDILAAELVVIDELAAARSTEWVLETIELLIGSLYNNRRSMIVTTNFPNLGPGSGQVQNEYARASRQETLGDRIGARMFSRLQQRCATVEINGPDWRSKK